MGVGIANQRSLWLCEVQLQHQHHPLQRHYALPNQTPPVSQAFCTVYAVSFSKFNSTEPASDHTKDERKS